MADSLRRIEGAFSLVMLTPDRIFAARDPRGFRPLVMGRIPGQAAHRADTIVFASETCAFDLHRRRSTSARSSPVSWSSLDPKACTRAFMRRHSRNRAASSSTSISRGPTAWFSDARCRRRAMPWDASSHWNRRSMADIVVPVPDSGVTAAMGFSHESGIPLQFGLIRNHYVGRTFIEPEQRVRDFGVKLKLNPGSPRSRRQASRADRRFDRSRHHQPQDCPHGAR